MSTFYNTQPEDSKLLRPAPAAEAETTVSPADTAADAPADAPADPPADDTPLPPPSGTLSVWNGPSVAPTDPAGTSPELPTGSASAIPAPPLPADDAPIRGYLTAAPTAIRKLNADFGLSMTEARFTWIKRQYQTLLHREPTVGELRILDALETIGRGNPAREAVGELYTDSPAIAETWTDVMHKHTALSFPLDSRNEKVSHPAPPCTFADVLAIPERYAVQTAPEVSSRELRSATHVALLAAPWQEAMAAAQGYRTVAHLLGEGALTRTVVTRIGTALGVTGERTGDLLLLLSGVAAPAIAALVDHERRRNHPDLADIRALSHTSILEAVTSLCDGAELYPDRLPLPDGQRHTPGRLPTEALCAVPATGYDPSRGTAAFLLRVSAKRSPALSETLRGMGLVAVVLGVVTSRDRFVFYMRNAGNTADVPAAMLPGELIRKAATVHLHRRRAEATLLPPPPAVTPDTSTPRGSGDFAVSRSAAPIPAPLARCPGTIPRENGITPNGGEVVTLTLPPDGSLTIPELGVSLHSVIATVTVPGEGYAAALQAVEAATVPFAAQGHPPHTISLSVSLHATDGVTEDGAPTPGSMALEVICGLYRAATEGGFPLPDPAITVSAPADGQAPSVSLSVVAHAKTAIPITQLTAETANSLPEDHQWNLGLGLCHKESTAYLLPVLRRSWEGSLHAIATALRRRDGAAVALQPVVIEPVKPTPTPTATPESAPTAEPVSLPTDGTPSTSEPTPAPALTPAQATDPAPAADTAPLSNPPIAPEATPAPEAPPPSPSLTEAQPGLAPASIAKLVEQLKGWCIPIFAMSEADARLLLEEPTVRAALDTVASYHTTGIVVLGEACIPFAEWGFLPAELARLTTVPAAGCTATVTYDGAIPPVRRLLRRDLLTPQTPPTSGHLPPLLTITLPDGTTVTDGFRDPETRTVALLGGLDFASAALTRIFGDSSHDFGRMFPDM